MATMAELLAQARQRHQIGDLAGATHLYRQLVAIEPSNAEVLALLAVQRGFR
jgi:hypothetical protein